jgi:hypothetical protein
LGLRDMKYKCYLGRGLGYLNIPVHAVRPLTPYRVHPMAHNLALERNWYTRRVQVLIDGIIGVDWITIDKHDLIKE